MVRELDERPGVGDAHRVLIPMSAARQLELAFEDAPRWEASLLEDALAREAGRPLRLVLTDNRSVLLSVRRQAGMLRLRLHRMFLHAPECVVAARAARCRRSSPAAAPSTWRRCTRTSTAASSPGA